jgi:serine/threonine-protein kinase RsbW
MSTLRSLALPANIRRLLTWNVTSDNDLRLIRSGISQHFRTEEIAALDEVGQRVALVATELAGNALRHGAPPVVARLLRDDDCYVLDVSDTDLDHVPAIADPGPAIRAGGRGLLIAQSLADLVCWYRDETAKHVWASFPVAAG